MSFRILNRRHVLMGAAALAAPTLLAACDQKAPIDEQGRIRLRLATPGPARADHGGFYQAIATGLYAKRNLNVQIFHGNSADDVSLRLAAGTAELGLAQDSYTVLKVLSEHAPVKAVAAFFQKDPRVIIGHSRNGPRTLADIGERTLYVEDADWPELWTWLRTRYDLNTEQLVRPDTGSLAPFLENDESLLIGNLTREPAQVAAADPELRTRLFLPADDGYGAYANLLLATNAFGRDNTDALKDFIAATIEGWQDYLNGDPEQANTLIRRANPATPQGSLDTGRDLLKTYQIVSGTPASNKNIGQMNDERWQAFATQVEPSFNSPIDWKSAFTTEFLPPQG